MSAAGGMGVRRDRGTGSVGARRGCGEVDRRTAAIEDGRHAGASRYRASLRRMSAFNTDQRRIILTTFRYLDELLEGSSNALHGSDEALFAPYVLDVQSPQRKLLGDHLARLRYLMRRFLDAQEMTIEQPGTTASRAWQATLVAAHTALDEIRPNRLRGYGALPEGAREEIDALVAELRAVLKQMGESLAARSDTDLVAGLARLGAATREAALLRELARIVHDHGLVELRSTLAWLADRLGAPCLEVGLFGRVSSGKSSLLNWLLEDDILPTGVAPVTTVPTRIVSGAPPQATVHFAEDRPVVVGLERLRDFVTEDGNPDNRKNVVAVKVVVPARRLASGICLIDTPGLGSLATAGAIKTLAYLPRCDIAILLVDAAAGPGPEDIALARSLIAGGTELVTVLSRADLLSPHDRATLQSYLQTRLREQLGTDPPIWPVSVMGEGRALAERWMEDVLASRLSHHRELAAASLRRKLGGLRDAVRDALAASVQASVVREGVSGRNGAGGIGGSRSLIEATRGRLRDLGEQSQTRSTALLEAAALALARAWGTGTGPEGRAQVVAIALAHGVQAHGSELADELGGVQTRVEQALAALLRSFPASRVFAELPHPAGQPLFDPSGVVRGLDLRSATPMWLGHHMRLRLARARLRRQLAAPLEQSIYIYHRALRGWGLDYLSRLERTFSAAVSAAEAVSRAQEQPPDTQTVVADLKRLESWDDIPGNA